MSSAFLRSLLVSAGLFAVAHAQAAELRVCSDPNNLPFSNEAGQGFENRIAALIADDLGLTLAYTWRPQWRGFLRETLKAGVCDLVAGLPSNFEGVRTTRPYYRSAYVMLRRAEGPRADGFNDPALKQAKLGVQLVGDDGWNTPPAHALAKRGMVTNIRGFMVYGDYNSRAPSEPIVAAVANGEIDIGFVWGPVAGYHARRYPALSLAFVEPLFDGPKLPMAWDISMAVRKEDEALRQRVDDALARLKPHIDAILAEYGVPRLDAGAMAEARP